MVAVLFLAYYYFFCRWTWAAYPFPVRVVDLTILCIHLTSHFLVLSPSPGRNAAAVTQCKRALFACASIRNKPMTDGFYPAFRRSAWWMPCRMGMRSEDGADACCGTDPAHNACRRKATISMGARGQAGK